MKIWRKLVLLALAIALLGAGKWADKEIIDIHAHTGSFGSFAIGPDVLMRNLQQYGIKMALVSNIDGAEMPETRNLSELEANQATANLVQRFPKQLRGLLWARPEDGSAENVERFLNAPYQGLFVGIKMHPEFNHFQADDLRVDSYMKLCEKYRIPAVFHCGREHSNSSPSNIYALARRHPAVPVILYHSGFFADHEASIQAVQESISKKNAMLYLETAQVKPEDVLTMIQKVGADHVLFGTDATYYGEDHYGHYQEMIDLLQAKLSPEDFEKVTHTNAALLFRL